MQTGIEGIFQVVDTSQMEPDLEEDMVKYQIPAILFTYLRAAVTAFLRAQPGFFCLSVDQCSGDGEEDRRGVGDSGSGVV